MSHIPPLTLATAMASTDNTCSINDRAVDVLAIHIEVQRERRALEVSLRGSVGVDGEDRIGDGFDQVADCSGRIFDVIVAVFWEVAVVDFDAEGQTGEVGEDGHCRLVGCCWLCSVGIGLEEGFMRLAEEPT